jgi:hypothetical protein
VATGTLLGDEHDLTVLRQQLRRLKKKGRLEETDGTVAATMRLIESRRCELRGEAIPLGERLFAEQPRAMAKRMQRWWQVAREQPGAEG